MITALSPREKNIRNQWFYLTIGYFLVYPVLLYTIITTMVPSDYSIYSPFIADLSSAKNIIPTLGSFLVQMIFDVILVLALLHCAYKKPGIKVLTVALIIGLLGIPLLLIGLLDNYSPWNLGLFLLEGLGYLYWLYLSIQLRRVNQKILNQRL